MQVLRINIFKHLNKSRRIKRNLDTNEEDNPAISRRVSNEKNIILILDS